MLATRSDGAPLLLVSYVLAFLGICVCTQASGEDKTVAPLPKLECTSGAPCAIRVIDPTHAYHNLAEIFVKSKKDRSCIPVPVLAAAFAINAETMDEDSAHAALVDAYWRQRIFGENDKLPSLIFYTDKNGTRMSLDAHTVRGLMTTELVAGHPKFVAASPGTNASCMIVNSAAASQVSACLQAATENSPPADACKQQINAIQKLSMPNLVKVVGNIKIDGQDLKIDDQSLAHIIPRSQSSQGSSWGGLLNQPTCDLQFGVIIPRVTEEEVKTLSVKGVSITNDSGFYNCSPNTTNSLPKVNVNAEEIKQTGCGGRELSWDLEGTILAINNTQSFSFLISIPSAEGAAAPFEVHLELSTTPLPGGDAGDATWKLTGICPR